MREFAYQRSCRRLGTAVAFTGTTLSGPRQRYSGSRWCQISLQVTRKYQRHPEEPAPIDAWSSLSSSSKGRREKAWLCHRSRCRSGHRQGRCRPWPRSWRNRIVFEVPRRLLYAEFLSLCQAAQRAHTRRRFHTRISRMMHFPLHPDGGYSVLTVSIFLRASSSSLYAST
jgi:hypothetical protein